MAIGQWNSTTNLIPGYRETKQGLEKKKRQIKALNDRDQQWQLELYGSMISSLDFVLIRLETGRDPYYERNSRPWETDWINEYYSPNGYTIDRSENEGLTAEQRAKIQRAMVGLSHREIQCYMMHVVDGMSWRAIGLELHLGKTTVQYYIQQAKRKIEANKNSSLFLVE